MYSDAYDLVREILDDEQLNHYIRNLTGKHLTVIDSGPQVDTPAAKIELTGGEFNRKINTDREVNYTVSFAMPFWGADAFKQCISFLDIVLPIFFAYGSGQDNRNIITRAVPSISENDPEKDFWIISINLTIKVFINL